jgi:hypothetical protein
MESVQQFLSDTFGKAWDTFKVDPLTYVVASLIMGFVTMISLGLLAGPLTVGFIRIIKHKREGREAGIGDVFDFSSFVSSLLVMVILGVAIFIGTLLLVIPGLVVAVFGVFAIYEVAYSDVGPIEAIQNSISIVKEHFLNVLVLMIVVIAINMVGGSVMLGALLTVPFGMIMLSIAYEKITEKTALQPGAAPRFDQVPPQGL